jgi:hypothetical protein
VVILKGSFSTGMRGSIWPRVFIEGAGPDGGVRLPWAKVPTTIRLAAAEDRK